MRQSPLLIIPGLILAISGCGSRSAVTPAQDGSPGARADVRIHDPLDGSTPWDFIRVGDLRTRRDMGRADGRPGPCLGPAGEPLGTHAGTYKATWSGQLDCQFFGLSFDDADTSMVIELTPTLDPDYLIASGTLSLNSMMGKGTIEGTMDCFFELNADITFGVNVPNFNEVLTGTMQGTFLPTWGLPPHFGEGTWQAENPGLGCKGYGTWRGVW